MRFTLTDEQRDFGASLDKLLAAEEPAACARAWADGDTAPGVALWRRIAELGTTALLVPERADGLEATPVEMVVAFEALGRYAVPGPWVETVAYLTRLVESTPELAGRDELLTAIAGGEQLVSVGVAPHTPYALDADVSRALLVQDGQLRQAEVGTQHRSVDPTRRLFELRSRESLAPVPEEGLEAAFDLAVLACSAQLLGLGEQLLATTVDYVKQRHQFGRPVGSYQALKHQLADVRIALDFVRPLVLGAALSIGSADQPRDVSAAKVAASDAAYRAARTALQLHGAIGYTAEHDLSLWLLKVRALVSAWGTTSFHRGRVLNAISGAA
jgi:alkylation response protein AidB-like acyl-CoA dehydrogenase